MNILIKNAYGHILFEVIVHEPVMLPSVSPAAPAPDFSQSLPVSSAKKPELNETTDEIWIAPWLRQQPPKK
jgi:hypothetical protein